RAREVQPDDRVSAGPDQVPNGAVVAVDDPAVASRMLAHPGAKDVYIERLPVRLVMDRIELQAGNAEPLPDPPRHPGLARPRIAHDRHPAHGRDGTGPDRAVTVSPRARVAPAARPRLAGSSRPRATCCPGRRRSRGSRRAGPRSDLPASSRR